MTRRFINPLERQLVHAITTVIFDLGRVMVHLDPDQGGFASLMRRMGIVPREAFARFWDAPPVIGHMTGTLSPADFHRLVTSHYGLEHSFDTFADAWSDLFSPIDGMPELFQRVAQRHPVGILSDTDPLHWQRVLRMLPCLALARKPTLSFQTGYLKPHPGAYAAAVENSGSDPKHCLFIDDVQANVEGAREAGMSAIRFTGVDELTTYLETEGIL